MDRGRPERGSRDDVPRQLQADVTALELRQKAPDRPVEEMDFLDHAAVAAQAVLEVPSTHVNLENGLDNYIDPT